MSCANVNPILDISIDPVVLVAYVNAQTSSELTKPVETENNGSRRKHFSGLVFKEATVLDDVIRFILSDPCGRTRFSLPPPARKKKPPKRQEQKRARVLVREYQRTFDPRWTSHTMENRD